MALVERQLLMFNLSKNGRRSCGFFLLARTFLAQKIDVLCNNYFQEIVCSLDRIIIIKIFMQTILEGIGEPGEDQGGQPNLQCNYCDDPLYTV